MERLRPAVATATAQLPLSTYAAAAVPPVSIAAMTAHKPS